MEEPEYMFRRRDRQTPESAKPELSPEQARAILEEIREFQTERWRPGEDFLQSVQGLEPLERAEAWLKHMAASQDTYIAQEAVVYLISRKHDCTRRIREIVVAWKADERKLIEARMQPLIQEDLLTGEQTVLREGMSYSEASDLLHASAFEIEYFWDDPHCSSLSRDATMLRTAERCNIGGFDNWWLRLARVDHEMAVHVGVEPVAASFYLFCMCRSNYAIRLMRKTLDWRLDAIELPHYSQRYPWRRPNGVELSRAVDNLSYAAALVFANQRLRSHRRDTELVDRALDLILKHQHSNGSWCHWADDQRPSIEATAMAIHALALSRPQGWAPAVQAAVDWLWSVQDASGCWIEYGCDGVYLTVLVLDALELAEGRTNITFDLVAADIDRGAQEATLDSIQRSVDKLHLDLESGLAGLARGQAVIYRHISRESRLVVTSVVKEIEQGRIEQGELQRAVDAVRRALKRLLEVGLPIDDEELKRSLDDIYRAVSGDLDFHQKLELSIPIIPLLLQYKLDLGAGVELGALWRELAERSQKGG
jgi:hypothetical protein